MLLNSLFLLAEAGLGAITGPGAGTGIAQGQGQRGEHAVRSAESWLVFLGHHECQMRPKAQLQILGLSKLKAKGAALKRFSVLLQAVLMLPFVGRKSRLLIPRL